jgi:hypothetical protein
MPTGLMLLTLIALPFLAPPPHPATNDTSMIWWLGGEAGRAV